MNRDHTNPSANIRNYTDVDKAITNVNDVKWISPSVAAYGLPALELKPIQYLVSEKNIVKNSTSKANLTVTDLEKADRNFLQGTLLSTILLFLAVMAFHNITGTTRSSIVQETIVNEVSPNYRLNHSPSTMLVGEEVTPELIPGVVQETEVASCALIVGSFARKSNAIEMQQKVLAAGYELYTEEFQDFYRVGISMDCSDVKGASFSAIETDIGIDPWLRISF